MVTPYSIGRCIKLQAFFISTGIVALAEVGDKTQLLALVIAARFQRPLPIVAGILIATLLNHSLAAGLGSWLPAMLEPNRLRWILGVSFIAMAVWMLIPDELNKGDIKLARFGVFGTTLLAFFLAEMGDKTQIATVALAAQYHSLYAVVAGTTLGMLIVNVPAVYLGERIADALPVSLVQRIAAAVFAIVSLATILGFGKGFGL